jgi:hypothetical protein
MSAIATACRGMRVINSPGALALMSLPRSRATFPLAILPLIGSDICLSSARRYGPEWGKIPSNTDASPHADLKAWPPRGPPYLHVSLLQQRHSFIDFGCRRRARTKDLAHDGDLGAWPQVTGK